MGLAFAPGPNGDCPAPYPLYVRLRCRIGLLQIASLLVEHCVKEIATYHSLYLLGSHCLDYQSIDYRPRRLHMDCKISSDGKFWKI